MLDIRSEDGKSLIVSLSEAEVPSGHRRRWFVSLPQCSSLEQVEPSFSNSSSSLSDVLPRVSAASEWTIRGSQPMGEVAEIFMQRLLQYRAFRYVVYRYIYSI